MRAKVRAGDYFPAYKNKNIFIFFLIKPREHVRPLCNCEATGVCGEYQSDTVGLVQPTSKGFPGSIPPQRKALEKSCLSSINESTQTAACVRLRLCVRADASASEMHMYVCMCVCVFL